MPPVSGAVPNAAIELIKEFEGFHRKRPDGRAGAYADPLKGWAVATIGYGTIRYPDGRKVKQGDICTRSEAEAYLLHELEQVCRLRLEAIPTWRRMNENQRAALYCFAYNLGAGFYRGRNRESITRVCDSPERWNDCDWIVAQFIKYRNPGSNVEAGLLRRRQAEADLFLKPAV
jgi:GH24 family phage-related lysozyme (muramidase)